MEWGVSYTDVCSCCYFIGQKRIYHNRNKETVLDTSKEEYQKEIQRKLRICLSPEYRTKL
jgi:hypothetical protein